MSVLLTLLCSGCDAKVECSTPLRYRQPVSSVVPPGWVMFDPYTHVTYCPECWKSIIE